MLAGYTLPQVASRLGEPVHRVRYAIRSRGITPLSWIAGARVFGEVQIPVIAAALREIAARGKTEGRE